MVLRFIFSSPIIGIRFREAGLLGRGPREDLKVAILLVPPYLDLSLLADTKESLPIDLSV